MSRQPAAGPSGGTEPSRRGVEMRRGTKALVVIFAVSLVAVATAYASAAGPQRNTSADRTALMQAHRGGTMKLIAKTAGGTLDPQVNYTLQYWNLYMATYDGLLAFTKAAGNKSFIV